MRKNKTRLKFEEIQGSMATLNNELTILRSKCKHKNRTKKYKSDTGNWCISDDSYWIEFRCEDCGKFWSEDQ